MAVPSAQDFVNAWAAGMAGAGTKYKAGIQRFQGNPMQMAASAQARQKYAQNTAAAAQDGGAMQRGLEAADVNTWRNNALNIGAAALVSGATKGKPKLAAKAQQLVAAQQAAKDAAANATGVSGKVLAAVNAMRAAFGKPPLA